MTDNFRSKIFNNYSGMRKVSKTSLFWSISNQQSVLFSYKRERYNHSSSKKARNYSFWKPATKEEPAPLCRASHNSAQLISTGICNHLSEKVFILYNTFLLTGKNERLLPKKRRTQIKKKKILSQRKIIT